MPFLACVSLFDLATKIFAGKKADDSEVCRQSKQLQLLPPLIYGDNVVGFWVYQYRFAVAALTKVAGIC